MIKPIDIIKIIERLLKFPHPTVCRHYVAANLLDLLERNGLFVSDELAEAIVNADDENAIKLLENYELLNIRV